MGGVIAKVLKHAIFKNVEMKVIMLGLDAAGKTTTLYKLKLGEIVTTIPTIGMNVESAKYKNVEFTVWDVGGRSKIRALWRHYFQNCNALIFMVDANDRERIGEAQYELERSLREEELRDVPVLVMANKSDLPNAMSVAELTEKLQLSTVCAGRHWFVQASCATSGDGLYEGLSWLQETLVNVVSGTAPSAQSLEDEKTRVGANLPGVAALTSMFNKATSEAVVVVEEDNTVGAS